MWVIANVIAASLKKTDYLTNEILSVLNAVAPAISLGICIDFWMLLSPDRRGPLDMKSLYQHVLLAIITIFDLIIVSVQIRWTGLFANWIFAGCYAINTYAAYVIGGAYKFIC